MASRSKRMSHIFDALPGTSQREFVRTQLIPLLNVAPPRRSRRILRTASRRLKKFINLPNLDLQSKKNEVNGLLDELSKDVRSSTPQTCATRDELLREAVESIADWLNDVWVVAFEFKVDYMKAHSCLLFSLGVLDHVRTMQESCRCTSASIYVPITIKRSNGKVVKNFTGLGVRNVEAAVLWIWRDVFLALLASEDKYLTKHVPDMLSDIDDILKWDGLKLMFSGGKDGNEDEDDNDLGNYSDNEGEEHGEGGSCTCACHREGEGEDDGEGLFDDLVDLLTSPPRMRSEDHWPQTLKKYLRRLRRLVITRLIEIFKVSPSVDLFQTITDLDYDESLNTKETLISYLSNIQTSSGSALGAALEILGSEQRQDLLAPLLKNHIHLLRPQDMPHLLVGVRFLAQVPSHLKLVHKIMETELFDIARAVHFSLLGAFPRLDDPMNRSAIRDMLRLRAGTVTRHERVESWVNAVMMSNDPPQPIMDPGPDADVDANPNNPANANGNALPNPIAEAFAGFAMGMGMGFLDPFPPINANPGADDNDNDNGNGNPAQLGGGGGGAGGLEFGANPADGGGGELLGLFGMGMGMGMGGAGTADMSMNAQLLEEWQRPNMKERFERWTRVAGIITSGPLVLDRVYRRMLELMPYLAAPDLVNDMVGRIINKPSKFSACITLEAMNIFVKAQRKRFSEIRAKQKQQKKDKERQELERATAASLASASAGESSTGTSPTTTNATEDAAPASAVAGDIGASPKPILSSSSSPPPTTPHETNAQTPTQQAVGIHGLTFPIVVPQGLLTEGTGNGVGWGGMEMVD